MNSCGNLEYKQDTCLGLHGIVSQGEWPNGEVTEKCQEKCQEKCGGTNCATVPRTVPLKGTGTACPTPPNNSFYRGITLCPIPLSFDSICHE